jgi:transposase
MAKGMPAELRLERSERLQKKWDEGCLDDLLGPEHPARQVWDYVEELDLSGLYKEVQTTVRSSGRPAIDPALLLALWLYGTVDGVGSARLLDRLCERDAPYRWLCGGVGVNYHTLSDFRTKVGPFLDDLLSRSVAGLIEAGLIDAGTVAVDGIRIWASAGKQSFKRVSRLASLHEAALAAVKQLRTEVEEDPGSGERRRQARRLAVAEDRRRRLEAARAAAAEIEQRRQKEAAEQRRKKKQNDKPVRGSTSDPQARIMKMADGSFKPAYNAQIKTAVSGAYIIGVSVTDCGSDRGLLKPALDEVEQRYGIKPKQMLADGGYDSRADIEHLHDRKIELFCPLPSNTKGDPARPRRGDRPGTIAWRRRMASPLGQATYKRRLPVERPHAHMRNHGLRQMLVRGIEKVKAVVLMHAIAFNFVQFKRLGWI